MNSTAEKTGRKPRFSWAPPRFISLPENRSAVLAVRRLARDLGRRRSPLVPLFLYGPSGTGKSHLATALHDLAAARHSACRFESGTWPLDRPVSEWHCAEFLLIEDIQHLPAWAADSLA